MDNRAVYLHQLKVGRDDQGLNESCGHMDTTSKISFTDPRLPASPTPTSGSLWMADCRTRPNRVAKRPIGKRYPKSDEHVVTSLDQKTPVGFDKIESSYLEDMDQVALDGRLPDVKQVSGNKAFSLVE
ncbi:hypothetical protein CEP53_013208 [Fusarium sp. AF-6]|nr:hypothetical protein CEP53_013208 [Fusarium sp. AF-6]